MTGATIEVLQRADGIVYSISTNTEGHIFGEMPLADVLWDAMAERTHPSWTIIDCTKENRP